LKQYWRSGKKVRNEFLVPLLKEAKLGGKLAPDLVFAVLPVLPLVQENRLQQN
jgi:hypothetical protein